MPENRLKTIGVALRHRREIVDVAMTSLNVFGNTQSSDYIYAPRSAKITQFPNV
jgi:hypothetical protein